MAVTVMGEALVDVVVRDDGAEVTPGGSPANVALGFGRLGIETTLHTSIARDEFGELIKTHLDAAGVVVTDTSWSADRTSSAVATIGLDGSATYAFDVSWRPAPAPVRGPGVFHTGSIAAILEPGSSQVYAAAEAAKHDGAIVTFDPNIRPGLISDPAIARQHILDLVGLSDVVKLSDEDARWLFPDIGVDLVIDALLQRGPSIVAVTLGASGSVMSSGAHRIACHPAPVTAVDTIGAGDTFMAALIASILENPIRRGSTVPEAWMQAAARSASNAAAVTVSRKGADLPWAHELRNTPDRA